MNFYVGCKVVRVAEFKPMFAIRTEFYFYPDGPPEKGKVYVVSKVEQFEYKEGLDVGLTLVGCRKLVLSQSKDVPHPVYGLNGIILFRPLEELKAENKARYLAAQPKEHHGCR